MDDRSNGYEAVAGEYLAAREQSRIGIDVVENWACALPPRAVVLELACGGGTMTRALVDAGFEVYAIDASESMIAVLRQRLPGVAAECANVEQSEFFGRTFDAILAWGLLFLLDEATQRRLIGKVGRALGPGGQFLFTAPAQACSWQDLMTGRESVSLGRDGYREALEEAGMRLVEEFRDAGENHYYHAVGSQIVGTGGVLLPSKTI